MVVRLVHRRAGQVVHGRIDDAEVLGRAGLEEFDPRQQQAGIADQRAAGLEQHGAVTEAALLDAVQQRAGEGGDVRRRLVGIGDAQAAAHIDVRQADAFGVEPGHHVEHFVDRVQVRRDLGDLRTDMAVDADHAQVRHGRGRAVGRQDFIERDAELVALQAGGDVRVGLGIHVRVDAQRHRRGLAQRAGHLVEPVQLGDRFDVEAGDTGFERQAHLVGGLAHPREHHVGGLASGGQHAPQFPARDDVEAGAQLREDLQHRQVGVGLHGVLHARVAALAGGRVGAVVGGQGGARIDVGGRAEPGGNRLERDAFDHQGAVLADQGLGHERETIRAPHCDAG